MMTMCKQLNLEENSLVNINNYNNIKNIFRKYSFNSIAKAIYILNSYLPNRNLLDLMITLNYAFHNMKTDGKKSIEDYSSFVLFVESIRKTYKKHPFNTDVQVHDLGEIYYSYNNINYPVIVGTGHNHNYIFNYFIDELSKITNTHIEFENLFSYNRLVIDLLKSTFSGDSSIDNFEIRTPPEQYFYEIYSKYDSLVAIFKKNNLEQSLNKCAHSNQLHFTTKNERLYIMYNTSILIDYATNLLSDLEDTKIHTIVNNTIKTRLVDQFELSGEQNKILFNPMIMDDPKGKPIYFPISIILHSDAIYIIINEAEIINEIGFTKLYNQVITLASENRLFLGALKNHQYKVCPITSNMPIKFIQINPHININQEVIDFYDEDQSTHILALDFVYFILRSSDFKQIIKFIDNNLKSDKLHFSTDGLSGLFEVSLESEGMIELGAIEFSSSLSELYTPEFKIFDLFCNTFRNIPFQNNDNMFYNPFEWEIKEHKYGFDNLKRNGEHLLGYIRKSKENNYIFVCRNTSHFARNDLSTNFFNHLTSIDDILTYMFDKYWDQINMASFFKKGIQLFIIPETKRKEYRVGYNGFSGEYIAGDFNTQETPYGARIVIFEEKLFKSIKQTKTRIVECKFFIEVLNVIGSGTPDLDMLKQLIIADSTLPKLTNVLEIELPFYKNLNNISFWANDEHFINIRKHIASICKQTNINPGIYKLEHAKNIIRRMQENLIPDFISLINKYHYIDLHIYLTSLLAATEFDVFMMNKKIRADDSNITKEIAENYKNQNIIERQDAKNKSRYILYLIENNLRYGNRDKSIKCSDDMRLLLAYSDWLIVLQDNSDMFHWKMDSCSIEVTYDYRINTLFDDTAKVKYTQLTRRIYSSGTYTTDKIPFITENDKLLLAYEKDMKFSFKDFVSVLDILSDRGDQRKKHEISKDIVKYNKKDLINRIISVNTDLEEVTVNRILDSITVSTTSLSKIIRNDIEDEKNLIPIWEREYRPNRFELNPLLTKGDDLIYSPFLCFQTFNLWINSLSGLYPPHESRIPNILKEIEKQQQIAQKQMVIDIQNKFIEIGIPNPNKEYKLHKHGSHPENLGDYDILVFDDSKGVIWNLECKVLQHVGSISEFAKHQDSFFLKSKSRDQKFQKRIDYLIKNAEIVLKDAKVTMPKNFIFKHYMVTNKVFVSEFKEVSFKIITYSELIDLINSVYI